VNTCDDQAPGLGKEEREKQNGSKAKVINKVILFLVIETLQRV
jgi:hypothetical protein